MIKLPFRKDKELCRLLYPILGFYPGNTKLYRQALLHKSSSVKEDKGKWQNNERLEFLGDAVLDAVVGDIVYRHFEGKREGFLTNARSKIVQRATLNKLAKDIGLDRLITSNNHSRSHNSYMAGNAFEALVGAIYLDRGYDACMRFMEKRILKTLLNIDKVAYKEINFKSKLLEWSQKKRVEIAFNIVEEGNEDASTPYFVSNVVLEGIECGRAKGYSKKESQQLAAKEAWSRLRDKKGPENQILTARDKRLGDAPETPPKGNPTPQADAPKAEPKKEQPKKEAAPKAEPKKEQPKKEAEPKKEDKNANREQAKRRAAKRAQGDAPVEVYRDEKRVVVVGKKAEAPKKADIDIDFSDVSMREKTPDEIIAEAEELAWKEEQG